MPDQTPPLQIVWAEVISLTRRLDALESSSADTKRMDDAVTKIMTEPIAIEFGGTKCLGGVMCKNCGCVGMCAKPTRDFRTDPRVGDSFSFKGMRREVLLVKNSVGYVFDNMGDNHPEYCGVSSKYDENITDIRLAPDDPKDCEIAKAVAERDQWKARFIALESALSTLLNQVDESK